MEIEVTRPRRPRKTWLYVVKNNKKGLGLASADALTVRLEGVRLQEIHADPCLPGTCLGFFVG